MSLGRCTYGLSQAEDRAADPSTHSGGLPGVTLNPRPLSQALATSPKVIRRSNKGPESSWSGSEATTRAWELLGSTRKRRSESRAVSRSASKADSPQPLPISTLANSSTVSWISLVNSTPGGAGPRTGRTSSPWPSYPSTRPCPARVKARSMSRMLRKSPTRGIR